MRREQPDFYASESRARLSQRVHRHSGSLVRRVLAGGLPGPRRDRFTRHHGGGTVSKSAPTVENAEAIHARLIELQREKAATIAGCNCPQDTLGEITHRPGCAMHPKPASMMTAITEAIIRARLRRRGEGR